LKGDAQRFFFEELQGKRLHLAEAFERLTDRFDTPHHQSQAQSYLNTITIEGIRSERKCSDVEALTVAHERITNTLPKCGPLCQSDGFKIMTMERIVKFEKWAAGVITTRSSNPDMFYSSYYTMLCTAVNLHSQLRCNEINSASHPSSTTGDPLPSLDPGIPVHYGQTYTMPQYHDNRRGIPKYQTRGSRHSSHRHPPPTRRPPAIMHETTPSPGRHKHTTEQLAAIKARTRCAFCNEIAHWRQECRHRQKSLSDVVKARIKEKRRDDPVVALAEVLNELTQEEEHYLEYQSNCSQNDINNKVIEPRTAIGCTETHEVTLQPSDVMHNAYMDDHATQDACAIFDAMAADRTDTDF